MFSLWMYEDTLIGLPLLIRKHTIDRVKIFKLAIRFLVEARKTLFKLSKLVCQRYYMDDRLL